jgi:membrane protease YdiL (CAAX protease family)
MNDINVNQLELNPIIIEASRKNTFWLILGYLFVRILVTQILKYFLKPVPDWLVLLTEFTMYLVIGLLLLQEKERLASFNIDRLSLILFCLSGTLLRTAISTSVYRYIFDLATWGFTIYLVFALWKSIKMMPKMKFGIGIWILLAALIGFSIAMLDSIPRFSIVKNIGLLSNRDLFTAFVGFLIQIVFQFGHAAALEEPIFRGFLWGFLRDKGWKEKWVLLFSTLLFWISHFSYFGRPYTFWFILPIMGLVLGCLAWKSRSIATSMTAHTIYNAGSAFIGYLLSKWI